MFILIKMCISCQNVHEGRAVCQCKVKLIRKQEQDVSIYQKLISLHYLLLLLDIHKTKMKWMTLSYVSEWKDCTSNRHLAGSNLEKKILSRPVSVEKSVIMLIMHEKCSRVIHGNEGEFSVGDLDNHYESIFFYWVWHLPPSLRLKCRCKIWRL